MSKGKRTRRRFTAEFKAETVKLVKQSNRTMADVAMELGISAKSVGEWVRLSEESGDSISEDERNELRRLLAFYVEAHKEVMPHSAFEGQTPNEVFFGTGDAVVAKLAPDRVQAQTERMARNRSVGCGLCIERTR